MFYKSMIRSTIEHMNTNKSIVTKKKEVSSNHTPEHMEKMREARKEVSYEGSGRPPIDKSHFVEEVDVYLATCGDKIKMMDAPTIDGEITQVAVKDVELPSIQSFALHLGVSLDTIYSYIKESREFSEAIKKIRLSQHKALISGGLSGRHNPMIAKLILATNHGYSEKSTVIDPTHSDAPKSVDEEMESIIKEAERAVLNKDVQNN